MSEDKIVNLKEYVKDGDLFHPVNDEKRIEAFIPTPHFANHASNLVELSNGDLLCSWCAGDEEGELNINVVMSRLKSDGNKWSQPVPLTNDPNRAEANCMPTHSQT